MRVTAYARMSGADRAKVVAFVLLMTAVPAIFLVPWAHRHLTIFFANPRAQVFGQVLVAILLEAFPFVLAGAILSGLIEVLVPAEALARLVPRGRAARLALAPLLGVIFPVCECGVIPVVRRLIRKGLPLDMAVAYLLAGPILNPIVLASTVMAFAGRREMLAMPLARALGGYAAAVVVGLLVARWVARPNDAAPAHADHAHGAGVGVFARIVRHVAEDFLLLGGYLLFGSILAAAVQAYLPRTVILSAGTRPVVSTLGMMALAFGLNLCSEADAFVAASFTQFTFAAKLGFLVLGPMLDVKLVAMYLGALPRRVLLIVLLVVPPLTLVLSELAGRVFEAIP
jgi:uncharacterized membrane protein YraQ (UPF0718 family)